MVVPSLTALLANAPRYRVSNLFPLRHTLFNAPSNRIILQLRPFSLSQARLQNLLPSMKTLHVSALPI
jgi:hypothetical protein